MSARNPDTLAYSGQNDFVSGSPGDTRGHDSRHSEVREIASNLEKHDSELSWQEKLKSPYQKERVELYWQLIANDSGIHQLLRGLQAPDLPDDRKQEMIRFCLDYLFSPYVSQTACWNGFLSLLATPIRFPSQSLQEIEAYVAHLDVQWPPEGYWDVDSQLIHSKSFLHKRANLLFPLLAQAEVACQYAGASLSTSSQEVTTHSEKEQCTRVFDAFSSDLHSLMQDTKFSDVERWNVPQLIRDLSQHIDLFPQESSALDEVFGFLSTDNFLQSFVLRNYAEAAEYAVLACHPQATPEMRQKLDSFFLKDDLSEETSLKKNLLFIQTLAESGEVGKLPYLQAAAVQYFELMVQTATESAAAPLTKHRLFHLLVSLQSGSVRPLDSTIRQSSHRAAYQGYLVLLLNAAETPDDRDLHASVCQQLIRLSDTSPEAKRYTDQYADQSQHEHGKELMQRELEDHLRRDSIEQLRLALTRSIEAAIQRDQYDACLRVVQDAITIESDLREHIAEIVLHQLKDTHLDWFRDLQSQLKLPLPVFYFTIVRSSQMSTLATAEAFLAQVDASHASSLGEQIEPALYQVAAKYPELMQSWLEDSPIFGDQHDADAQELRSHLRHFVIESGTALNAADVDSICAANSTMNAAEWSEVAQIPWNRVHRDALLMPFVFQSEKEENTMSRHAAQALLSPWRIAHLSRVLDASQAEHDLVYLAANESILLECAAKWETMRADSFLSVVRQNIAMMASLEMAHPGAVAYLHESGNGNISFFHRYGIERLLRQYELLQSKEVSKTPNLAVFFAGQSDYNTAFDVYEIFFEVLHSSSEFPLATRYQQVIPESLVYEVSSVQDIFTSMQALYHRHQVRNVVATSISGHGSPNSIRLGDSVTTNASVSFFQRSLDLHLIDDLFAVQQLVRTRQADQLLGSWTQQDGLGRPEPFWQRFWGLVDGLTQGEKTALSIIACSGARGDRNVTTQLQRLLQGVATGYGQDHTVQMMILVQDTQTQKYQFIPVTGGSIKVIGD